MEPVKHDIVILVPQAATHDTARVGPLPNQDAQGKQTDDPNSVWEYWQDTGGEGGGHR